MTELQTARARHTPARRRVPVILQSQTTECGLACLAMVAGAHGYATDLTALRRRFSVSLRGLSLRGLINIADSLGLHSRALRVEPAAVSHVALPAIFHWDLRHFVVLVKIRSRLGKKRYLIHDPARGPCWISESELSEHFTGVALELMPAEQFHCADERQPFRLSELWSQASGMKRSALQVLFLSGFLQIAILVSPMFIQTAVDVAVPSLDMDLVSSLALGFAGVALITGATSWLRSYVLVNLGNQLAYQMVANLFRHLLRLPLLWLQRRGIGDLHSRLGSLHLISELLSQHLLAAAIDGLLAVACLPFMLMCSPSLTAITIVAFATPLGLRLATLRRQRECVLAVAEAQATAAGMLIETLRGVSAIKAAGQESSRCVVWQNRKGVEVNAQIRLGTTGAQLDAVETTSFALENVVFVYVAAHMIMANTLTVGMAFAYLAYKQNFVKATSRLIQAVAERHVIGVHVSRVADVVRADVETDREWCEHHSQLSGTLELRDVRFRYGAGDPYVLKGINLEIRAGETIAVVGSSGSGKTTLLKVLQGLYAPTDGEVLVDGQRLEAYGKAAYRSQIGVVAQDDMLYAGTIAENIAFFDPEIDMKRVVECAQAAAVHGEVQAMPMQYESLVGDMGSALSGGQIQRLLLARALYRQPRILFMDEGTAHLDVSTEAKVNASIRALGITRVLAAHRPETIRAADRAVSLADGRIVESHGIEAVAS